MNFRGCFGMEEITPGMAAAAMLLVIWNTEPDCRVMAFSSEFQDLEGRITRDMTIEQVMNALRGVCTIFAYEDSD